MNKFTRTVLLYYKSPWVKSNVLIPTRFKADIAAAFRPSKIKGKKNEPVEIYKWILLVRYNFICC